MIMYATVLEVTANNLLVRDQTTLQEVVVHTDYAKYFCPCDNVRIEFSGAMTMSIPPQISARCIVRV